MLPVAIFSPEKRGHGYITTFSYICRRIGVFYEYLKEVIGVLNRYNPDWNKERELGSWAAEFILDLLEETEEEFDELGEEGRCARFAWIFIWILLC